MRIFVAKSTFKASPARPNSVGSQSEVIHKGQTFILNDPKSLPDPIIGGITDLADVYEEIVPKNLLIKLDSFVKVKAL